MKKRCAIYTRVSTTMQAEKDYSSCDAQRDRIENYIKSQEDLEWFREYRDPGFTAANINRPALQEMMRDIESGKVDCVLTYKIDRLTRSSKDFYNLIEVFDNKGVTYVSVTEHFNTASAAGRLLRNIMLTFAQFEREMTSERVRDKCQQNAMKGLWGGGYIPYGYQRSKKGTLTHHPKSAKWVPLIFEKFSETKCVADTYQFVKDHRLVHDHLHRVVTINSVKRMLHNPVYIGKIRWRDQIFDGQHKPLVSKELFDHVQQLKQKRNRKKKCNRIYSLKQLITCSECGSNMGISFTNKAKRQYYYYECFKVKHRGKDKCSIKRVNAEKIEHFLSDYICRIADDTQYIESIAYRKLTQSSAGGRSGLELETGALNSLSFSISTTLKQLKSKLESRSKTERMLALQKTIKGIVY